MSIRKNKIVDYELSEKEKQKIIDIYALKICKLWDYYNETAQEIFKKFHNGDINKAECCKRIKLVYEETRHMFAILLIEQFYNTGDETFFDRAIKIDEDIELSSTSYIDMDELNKSEEDDAKDMPDITLFYNGIFITLKNDDQQQIENDNEKLIIRDFIKVDIINKKLCRGRKILEIDEVTLGKKYYDGLCRRTHYK